MNIKSYREFIIESQIENINESINFSNFEKLIGNIMKSDNFMPLLKKIWDKIKYNSKLTYIFISILIFSCGLNKKAILDSFEQTPELINAIKSVEQSKSPDLTSLSYKDNQHKVSKNETLYSISKLYNIKPSDLIDKNRLTSNTITPNQILQIPTQEEIDTYKQKDILGVDKNGFLNNKFIVKKWIKELEHGDINKINAIILHRTATKDVKGTLNGFKKRRVGTHFLVGFDGTIYQTASLNKFTAHILNIKSKGYENGTCSKEEKEKIKDIGWNPRKLHVHELKKSYPTRYPYNKDAVGIEVMGDFSGDKWDELTPKQIESVKLLVNLLKGEYDLTYDDIYTHEEISYKQEGEGGDILKAITK